MLVGNEYNLPWARLGEKRDFLRAVGADYVGTQLPIEAGRWLYADTGAKVLALPHALNDRRFSPRQAGFASPDRYRRAQRSLPRVHRR